MKESSAYDLFTQASKLILLIPVILLVLIVMLEWGGWGREEGRQVKRREDAVVKPTAAPVQAVSLNLTGPFVCSGKVDNGTMSAMIKDRNIIATLSAGTKTTRLLVKGDCAYSWEGKAGVKKCGLGDLIATADGLLSTGLVSLDTLIGSAGFSGTVPKGINAQSITKSCTKKAVIPAGIFEIPKGVQFTEKKE